MRINSSDKIGDFNAIDIREVFKQYQGRFLHLFSISAHLHISESESSKLIKELETLELVKKSKAPNNEECWILTDKGNQFALATAAKPIKRSTADKKVAEFLSRVKVVNSDPYYLYKIVKVIVFGSYLSDKERINDVDLAVQFSPKVEDDEEFRELTLERTNEAIREGRIFSNFVEEVYWAKTEVKLFLKSRSRSLSLHSIGDGVLETTETKILFEED